MRLMHHTLLDQSADRFQWSKRQITDLFKGFNEPDGAYALSRLPPRVQIHVFEEMTGEQKRTYLPYLGKRAMSLMFDEDRERIFGASVQTTQ